MKATEQYFPVVLYCIMLYKVVLTFEAVGEILKCDCSIESYWAVLFWGTVYRAVQDGSNFVDEILKCGHSNESYEAIPFWGIVYCSVQDGPNFCVCEWSRTVWPFKRKLLSGILRWYCTCDYSPGKVILV